MSAYTDVPSGVTLTPAGQAVRVLSSEAEGATCQPLGEVTGPPPCILPGDAVNRMKNAAGAKGGNALYVTNGVIGIATGLAYLC